MVRYSSKNDTNNVDLRYLCRTSDITPSKSRSFLIRNRSGTEFEIAVFSVDGKYYAISNRCKHEGGPLSEGVLRKGVVTCPWHGWKYSIVDGKSPHKGGDSVDSYETSVNNGRLYVNTIPSRVDKQVSVPLTSYVNLKNSVNKYLK